jgi:hypothetical protein
MIMQRLHSNYEWPTSLLAAETAPRHHQKGPCGTNESKNRRRIFRGVDAAALGVERRSEHEKDYGDGNIRETLHENPQRQPTGL